MRAAAATALFFLIVITALAAFLLLVLAALAAFAVAATAAATAALVNVTVSNLFFSRGTHFLHGDVEVEVLARERVVPVDCNIVFFALDDTH